MRDDTFGNRDDNDDASGFGYSGGRMRDFLGNRLWFQGEALLWWTRGGETPPLLTTSPASTSQPNAGVLGQANTSILFGDQPLNNNLHAGGRLSFGVWLDQYEQSGLEFSYLILGQNTQAYSNQSMGNPILARPFYNVTTGAQDAVLIAYPNAFNGTFNALSVENFEGAEALWRRALVRGGDGRTDLLLGYRYQRLTDGLTVGDSITTSGTSSVPPAGTTINTTDLFHTRNNFNGGELGFAMQCRHERWTVDTTLKMGIGATETNVLINGWTSVITGGTTTARYNGGLLALASNMGTHDSWQFSTLPEIDLTLGYDLTPRLKATLGYSLLYWSGVARPGDQIDLNVNPKEIPPPTTTAGERPEFVLHTSDFWAQGLNLGLEYRF